MRPTVIVGAGIAGLTIAHELTKAGKPVLLVEKEDVVGGLARTFWYGDFAFDIGPHRFHTFVPSVMLFIDEILGDERVVIKRRSSVYLLEKYHAWPIHLSILFELPFKVLLLGARDLIFHHKAEARTFRDHIINMYGPTLYKLFFESYSEKFLGLSPALTDADWAKTGIDRAIIDKRVKAQTLREILQMALMPKGIETEFVYPRDGMSAFCEKVAKAVTGAGAEVRLGATVDRITRSAGDDRIESVTIGQEEVAVEDLVWTAPIHTVCALLDRPRPELDYLSLLLYNVELDTDRVPHANYQWCYFGEKHLIFNRISVPRSFSPGLIPPDKMSLCVELTCRENDERWQHPETLLDRVRADLCVVGHVERPSDIRAVHIEKIPNAYPIYRLGYRSELDAVQERLAGFQNLHLAGRTGRFWYNNMDHSIEQGLELAAQLTE